MFSSIEFVSSIIGALAGAVVGGFFAIWGAKMTIKSSMKQFDYERELERTKNRENSLNALMIELVENNKAVEATNVYRYLNKLQDSAWNNAKHLLGFFDTETMDALCHAYVAVGRVNNAVQEYVSKDYATGNLARQIFLDAKEPLNNARMKLENFINETKK